MTYSYIALIWDSSDLGKAAIATDLRKRLLVSPSKWRVVVEMGGLVVMDAGARSFRTYVLRDGRGVVLGKLFGPRTAEFPRSADAPFTVEESRLIAESHGRHLIEHYWGRYVAFLRCGDGLRQVVLRDPTGGLLCLRTALAGVQILLSDADDLLSLDLPELSINWDHIVAFLHHVRMVTRTTGINELSQLYAGECLEFENGRETATFLWSPAEIYLRGAIDDPVYAQDELKAVTQRCVAAWAEGYESILLQLSGGLDSSIVLACLSSVPSARRITCVNFSTEAGDGDERLYARAAARNARVELVQGEWHASGQSLEGLLNQSPFASPTMARLRSQSDALKEQLVLEIGVQAVFTGQGGDHLFHSRTKPFLAAEYLYRHGMDRAFFKIVRDAANLTSETVWSVLRAAVTYGYLNISFDPYRIFDPPPFLGSSVYSTAHAEAFQHPWVAKEKRVPQIKLLHIHDLVDTQPFNHMTMRYADLVHPLISQPIIECCLRIPSFILASGGIDRALARRAFATELPPEIIQRTSKGGTTSYFNRLIAENRAFLLEFLCDGLLSCNGILDKGLLEKCLSERELIYGKHLLPLLAATRAEAWLRCWQASGLKVTT